MDASMAQQQTSKMRTVQSTKFANRAECMELTSCNKTSRWILVSFAEGAERQALVQRQLISSARELELFDDILVLNMSSIPTGFLDRVRSIMYLHGNDGTDVIARGIGYWIWKPFLAFQMAAGVGPFASYREEDVFLYMDSDNAFTRGNKEAVRRLLCFGIGNPVGIMAMSLLMDEAYWTKRDAFILTGTDLPEYANSLQHYAGMWLLRRNPLSLQFATQWLAYAQDARVITDKRSELGADYSQFIEHRHDQSIFSLLNKKWSIPGFHVDDVFQKDHGVPGLHAYVVGVRCSELPIG
jgi:hypothetical protein